VPPPQQPRSLRRARLAGHPPDLSRRADLDRARAINRPTSAHVVEPARDDPHGPNAARTEPFSVRSAPQDREPRALSETELANGPMARSWKAAASDLGIRFVSPFVFEAVRSRSPLAAAPRTPSRSPPFPPPPLPPPPSPLWGVVDAQYSWPTGPRWRFARRARDRLRPALPGRAPDARGVAVEDAARVDRHAAWMASLPTHGMGAVDAGAVAFSLRLSSHSVHCAVLPP